MCIAGYFVRPGPGWRTPKGLRNVAERDEVGIKVEGTVLSGQKSLQERLAEDAVTAGGKLGSLIQVGGL
jgi:hypothetical protein